LARTLALFDLDHTLIPFDSGSTWFRYLSDIGVLREEDYAARNQEFATQYKAGQLDVLAFHQFCLAPLALHPRAQLDAWRESFKQAILPRIPAGSRALVDAHRNAGDLCCIVTATNSYVAGVYADIFNVPNLIGTEPAMVDGRADGDFTGDIQGTPSYGPGKVPRVKEWLAAQGLSLADFDHTICYSDSFNDIPLLEAVDEAVAVGPDATLREVAESRGWRIIARPGVTGQASDSADW
jgi:HAD superfamily hydrolase (TIGR01490 family)